MTDLILSTRCRSGTPVSRGASMAASSFSKWLKKADEMQDNIIDVEKLVVLRPIPFRLDLKQDPNASPIDGVIADFVVVGSRAREQMQYIRTSHVYAGNVAV